MHVIIISMQCIRFNANLLANCMFFFSVEMRLTSHEYGNIYGFEIIVDVHVEHPV